VQTVKRKPHPAGNAMPGGADAEQRVSALGQPAERRLRGIRERHRRKVEDDRRRVPGNRVGRSADHGGLVALHVDLDQRDRDAGADVVDRHHPDRGVCAGQVGVVQEARPGPVVVPRARPEKGQLARALAGGGADDPDIGQAVERDVAVGSLHRVRIGLNGDHLAAGADQPGKPDGVHANARPHVDAPVPGPDQVSEQLGEMLLVTAERPQLPLQFA
jgi:hypothetical protein